MCVPEGCTALRLPACTHFRGRVLPSEEARLIGPSPRGERGHGFIFLKTVLNKQKGEVGVRCQLTMLIS